MHGKNINIHSYIQIEFNTYSIENRKIIRFSIEQ